MKMASPTTKMVALGFIMLTQIAGAKLVFAQAPPPTLDNFLDDEDFDAPPPGFNPNARNNGAATPPNNAPALPDFTAPGGANGGAGGGSASNGNGTSFKGAKPNPRRNRKEPPNLLAKRPPNMATASDDEINNENFPDLIDSFDYPNAEIGDIVKAISELTGRNFIVDPTIHGKITIIAPSRVTVAEAYRAFLSALAVNGLSVIPSGKFWKVKQAQNALRDSIETYAGNYSPNTDNIITRIVQLQHISVRDVFNNLNMILTSRLGEMRPYEPTNTLILSDYGTNIERIMKILKQLDVPGFEEQMEVIKVRYAKADDLSKLIDQVINKGKNNQNGNGFTAGIPRFTPIGSTPQSNGNDAFSLVIPDARTNTLIVVGNTQGIDKIRKLVAKLDFRIRPEDAGGVYVYYVRYGDAEKIATTLSGLAQSATQANSGGANTNPGGLPGAPFGVANPTAVRAGVFGGDVKVVSDKTTNSIVVTASKQDYETVRAILAKLDVARDQVFVEAIIAELQVNNRTAWGITYYNLPGGSFAGRSGFNSAGSTSLFDPGSDNGGVLGFGGGGGVQTTLPASLGGATVTIPSLVGFLNFLQSVTDLNVLSTPQIMALDNEEAEIEVGDIVPVASSQSAAANGQTTNSVDREPITIKLNIKPHISPGSNNMRLEIDENVADLSSLPVSSASNLANNAIATTKRHTKTNVMARDGDTIVMGGLMQDKTEVIETKIPLLGDIPILGWLFKGKSTQKKKQNLVMFLTPKIIRGALQSTGLLKEKLGNRTKWIEQNAGGNDKQGAEFNNLQLHQDKNNADQMKIEAQP